LLRPLNIACLQTHPKASISEAIEEAMPLAEAAVKAGAEFIFLPEYCGGLASEGAALRPPAAQEKDHPMLGVFQAFARDYKVWVMLGSIAVTAPDAKILNRGYIIDSAGIIQSHYDKIHLFDVQISEQELYRESAHVLPGAAVQMTLACGMQLGHTICYDLRFPKLFRDLAQAGAEAIAVPAAFVKNTGKAHWHVLNRARAIENGCFIIAPCAVGPIPGGGESYGHSLIVDPWGQVLVDGGEDRGFIQATIDLSHPQRVRSKIPSLTHDRAYSLQ
jgi:predicted amidohydrolase